MPSDKVYLQLQPYTTRRPKLPTVLSISQYTRRNCAIHIPIYSRAMLYQGTLPSYSYTIYCSASRNQTAAQPWSPKRRQRAAATKEHLLYAHVIIAVAARFRLISSMPSLMNHRGHNLHTVDVNHTTWYVHREGVPSTSAKATIAISMLMPFSTDRLFRRHHSSTAALCDVFIFINIDEQKSRVDTCMYLASLERYLLVVKAARTT